VLAEFRGKVTLGPGPSLLRRPVRQRPRCIVPASCQMPRRWRPAGRSGRWRTRRSASLSAAHCTPAPSSADPNRSRLVQQPGLRQVSLERGEQYPIGGAGQRVLAGELQRGGRLARSGPGVQQHHLVSVGGPTQRARRQAGRERRHRPVQRRLVYAAVCHRPGAASCCSAAARCSRSGWRCWSSACCWGRRRGQGDQGERQAAGRPLP
jgi:hypothetical protein